MDPLQSRPPTDELVVAPTQPSQAAQDLDNFARRLFAATNGALGYQAETAPAPASATTLEFSSNLLQQNQEVQNLALGLLGGLFQRFDQTQTSLSLGSFASTSTLGIGGQQLEFPPTTQVSIPKLPPLLPPLVPNHEPAANGNSGNMFGNFQGTSLPSPLVPPFISPTTIPTDLSLSGEAHSASSALLSLSREAHSASSALLSLSGVAGSQIESWQETQHQSRSPSGAPGAARRERQHPQSSHPYHLASSNPQHLSAASSAANGQNTSTFFWLGPDSGWIFPPKPVEGAQRPQIGQDILAQCRTCGLFVLPIPDVIAEHQGLHRGDTFLICGHDSCKESFPNLASRTRHLNNFHDKVTKEQYCLACKNDIPVPTYRSYFSFLAEHFLWDHFHVKSWQCAFCGSDRVTLETLYNHHRQAHSDTPKSKDDLRTDYINLNTGLPCNARYVSVDGSTIITAYSKNQQLPNTGEVDWKAALIHHPFSSAHKRS